MFDAQMFEEWLRKGVDRSPNLYGGKVAHKPVDAPRNASQAHSRPLGEQMHKERVEFDRKQATDDHNDSDCREIRDVVESPGIPEEWDGYEPEEAK